MLPSLHDQRAREGLQGPADPREFLQLASSITDQAEVMQLKELMCQGLTLIDNLSDPEYDAITEYRESDEAWLDRMISYAPDPDQFQAGRLHACLSCWHEYFQQTGNSSANAKKVISWLRDGIKFPFVKVQHKSHDKAPDWRRKIEVVRRMLGMAVGQEQVEACLQKKTPARGHFPNHKSAQTHAQFVDAELAKAEAKGVVKERPSAEPPKVINHLWAESGYRRGQEEEAVHQSHVHQCTHGAHATYQV